ncbi:MAG: aminoglycoside phosphotransferase family protein [Actinomycetota bacterium]|nr:aminoglycoside phosphotransferase family protein [Actinomycetota bacterium]
MITTSDADAIGRAFALGPDAVLTGPVARGEVGQIWRLTTATADWAVKEAFEPPAAAEAEHDAAFQEMVAAAGVLVPLVRRSIDGRVLVDISGSLVRVYSWVDLAGRDTSVDPVAIASVVASIHRVIRHDANGVHPWYTDPVGADRWDELVAQLRLAGSPSAELLAEHRDELVMLESLLEPPSDLQACHRDLFADNVLATPSGELCVIDWENSGLADPGQELAVVVFEYGRGDAERTRTLHQAYVERGGPGRLRAPGDFSMLIAQLGHIGEVSCRRWLDPARVDERERNQARIDEFLDDRLTMASIHAILDAIG